MSTHARIGILHEDRTSVESVYLHFDGYAENVLPKLTAGYQTTEAVEDLIALGDLVSISADLTEVVAFARDRGERQETVDSQKHLLSDWPDDHEYRYLFNGSQWMHSVAGEAWNAEATHPETTSRTYLDKMTANGLDALCRLIDATTEKPYDSPLADEFGEVSPIIVGQLKALRTEIRTRCNAARTLAETE